MKCFFFLKTTSCDVKVLVGSDLSTVHKSSCIIAFSWLDVVARGLFTLSVLVTPSLLVVFKL